MFVPQHFLTEFFPQSRWKLARNGLKNLYNVPLDALNSPGCLSTCTECLFGTIRYEGHKYSRGELSTTSRFWANVVTFLGQARCLLIFRWPSRIFWGHWVQKGQKSLLAPASCSGIVGELWDGGIFIQEGAFFWQCMANYCEHTIFITDDVPWTLSRIY